MSLVRLRHSVASLLLVGLLAPAAGLRAQAAAPGAAASTESWNVVTRGSLRSILSPKHDIKLSSRAAGIVEKIHLPEGSRVSAGDALLGLDAQQETAELAQAEATLRGIEAEYERTRTEFARAEDLFRDNIISPKQYDEFRTSNLVLRSRRDQAKAAVDLAKVRLENRTVRSPIDGIFLKTSKSVGEAVERFETIARVVDPSSLRLVVFCDSSLRGRFTIGKTAELLVQSSPQRETPASGLIQHIDPMVDAMSGTFRIVIEVTPTAEAIAGLPASLVVPGGPAVAAATPEAGTPVRAAGP
jgi:RND family efflux transporter MFP subunit